MMVYDGYLPTNIKWLPKIPSHWKLKKIKYIFYISKEENIDDYPNILSLTQKGIIERDTTTNKGQLAQSYIGYNVIKKNDIIFNPMDLISGYVGKSNYDGIISQAYTTIRPYFKNNLSIKYYERYFQNWYHYGILWHIGKGVSHDNRWTLNNDTLLNIKVPFPPIEEQKAIASFLDKKCSNIENFISQKTKHITYLKELKTAIINECVTKGLDKTATCKESGIEWLGKIPSHWEVRKLSTLGHFSKGGGISKSDLSLSGLQAILYGDIYTKYNFKANKVVNKISTETANKSIEISKNTFLFTGSGETKEDIGKCLLYLGDDKVYVGGDVIIFKQKSQHSLFLTYVLNSSYVNVQKLLSSKGEIIVHIYASNIRDIKIALPPLKEQKQIATHIEQKIEIIDKLIEKTTKEIDFVKEYKTSLIDEVVSGKRKVKQKREANIQFKRAVLSAYIIDKNLDDSTFGRVKFQKILYMCEVVNNFDFKGDYERHAMGPHSPKMLNSIETMIKKSKWFETKKIDKRYVYLRLEKSNDYKKYIDKYYDTDTINKTINMFKKMNTQQSEIVATIYSAWIDLLKTKENIKDDDILDEVLNKWHENKKKISKEKWLKAINWMRKQNLVPRIKNGL